MYDGEDAPAYSMGSFTPSTVPGCRAPHVWLSEGVSLLDALGPGYTLVCSDQAPADSTACLQAAMTAARIPLHVLPATPGLAWPATYQHRWHLIRQDSHVVWRGNDITPAVAQAVTDRLRGVNLG
jgi:hypothetical protein